MSILQSQQRFSNPIIPSKKNLMNKHYGQSRINRLQPINQNSNNVKSQISQLQVNQYPISGSHSKFPVTVYCQRCGQVEVTQTVYKHGFASKFWCILLIPALCTGMCCLCLPSCKDVQHYCSHCLNQVGTYKAPTC